MLKMFNSYIQSKLPLIPVLATLSPWWRTPYFMSKNIKNLYYPLIRRMVAIPYTSLVHLVTLALHVDNLGGNPSHGSIDKSSWASSHITLSPRTVHHTTMAPSNNSTRMSFSNKFKLKAVEIAEQIGNRAAAKQLRIGECNIRRWRQEVLAISQAPKNKCCTKA